MHCTYDASMSLSELQSLYSAARSALESGDFDTAIAKATLAQLLIATTPDVSRALAGGGNQSLGWRNAAAIESFIAQCQRLKATSAAATTGPFQQTKILYQRPDCLGTYE